MNPLYKGHPSFEVFELLRRQGSAVRGSRSLELFEHPICNKGFMRALGIGKHRFGTLRLAAQQGLDVCPLDGRHVPHAPTPQSSKRAMVFDFLYKLYESAGEELPDKGHSSSNKRPRQVPFKLDPANMDTSQLRHLPPGRFMDYYRLCTAEFPDAKISLKLFSNAWSSKHIITNVYMIVLFNFSSTTP